MWVIAAMIRFCSSVYHEIWEVTAAIIAFQGFFRGFRALKSPQWSLIALFCFHSVRGGILQHNGMSYAISYGQKPEIDSGGPISTPREPV